MNPVKYQ